MARTNRLAALQKAIAELGEDKNQRRYDERLTKQIVAHARLRQSDGASLRGIGAELGVSPPTLAKMLGRESKLIPVRVVSERTARSSRSKEYLLRGPGGVVVEGLSLEDIAEILSRMASCSA